MKVLLVLGALLWLGADALYTKGVLGHHNPQHKLSETPWSIGQTHRYLLTVNMTVGVPGMTSQVAKSVIKMDVNIRPKTDTEYLLKIDDVQFSQPRSHVESSDDPVLYIRYPELERELSKTIKFTYEDGEVKSYTLGESETLQSKSIKRGILRHLEMKIHPDAKTPNSEHQERFYPLIYNTTESNEMGTYNVYYGIAVSPYPWFPYEDNVFNVSKTVEYEPYGYPSFHEHDNFDLIGCPEVCQNDDSSVPDDNDAGCPEGYKPHQKPLKASLVVHHNYRLVQSKMVIEGINVHESSVANMYDQDIAFTMESEYSLREISNRGVDEPSESQKTYDTLPIVPTEEDLMHTHPSGPRDVAKEYRWLYGIFEDLRSEEVLNLAEHILNKVSTTVMEGDIENDRGQEVTQDVAQLQDILSLMKKSHLENFFSKIIDIRSLRRASDEEKIKRQIFLDVLPLCGTDESIEFIRYLIEQRKLKIWEAKEVLEAIPPNIIEVNDKNIKDLQALLQLPDVKRYHILHSAAHSALASTIREGCIVPLFAPDYHNEEDEYSSSSTLWQTNIQSRKFGHPGKDSYDDDEDEGENSFNEVPKLRKMSKLRSHYNLGEDASLCKSGTVETFVQEMRTKLESTSNLQEKIVYLKAVSLVGHKSVLKILKPYVYGLARDIVSLPPSDVDYMKAIAIYSMYHIAKFYPQEVLELAATAYFNRTEMPRVRIAAFTILIRCQPPLAVLQHVAQDLWDEPSNEVGSFVYSALESFGNSSTPCTKLTADRIKLIISQAKTYDIGMQHSKSFVKTFFDDLSKLGIEKKMDMVHSNETFVPHALYTSLKYRLHSMQDVFLQAGAVIQGGNLEELLRLLDTELLGLKIPRDLPSSVEREIFGTLKLIPRLPKDLRITIFKKMFYTETFLYFDAVTYKEFFELLEDYLRDYLSLERGARRGYLVKTFIPSSIHSMTYSSLGLPLDFRMKHPLVISVKIESKPKPSSSGLSLSYYIRPSVYYATYHKKSLLNIFDRHAYGVYQEQKHTFTLPIELSVSFDSSSKYFEVTYKLPELPKRIYRHHAEAGTFETELKLRKIYSADLNRDTIETIPALFKRERVFNGFGLPPVYIVQHTEDIADKNFDLPRNFEDVMEMIIESVSNPGWRREDINATIVSPHRYPVNEVIFKINYNKKLDIAGDTLFANRRQASLAGGSSSWSHPRKATQDDDEDEDNDYSETDEREVLRKIWKLRGGSLSGDEKISPNEARKVIDAFTRKKLSKIAHEFTVSMETRPTRNTANLRVEYNCTFDRMVHSLMAWSEANIAERNVRRKMCLSHVMRYVYSPSEFHYDLRKYTGQGALFFNGIAFGDKCDEFDTSDVVAQGGFYKVRSEDLFERHEFAETPDREAFYPETHEECLNDIREGKSQSPACISAATEESHLNKFSVVVTARQDLPPLFQNLTYSLDRVIKQFYYGTADINRVNVRNPPRTFKMSMNYYEKLTDTPFVKVWMEKPDEIDIYRKIDTEYLLPLSSIYTLRDSYMLEATNNTYLPSCGLMEKYIRTYDMKVYPLPRDTCTYVLSTHCAERKKFSVLAKRTSPSSDIKVITVYLAGHKIEVKPSGSSDAYELVHNENSLRVTHEKPVLLDEETSLYVYLVPVYGHEVRYVLFLQSDLAGLKIQYDGKNTKLQVDPLYKGVLCGLCSEFDGEITREYRGPNQCLYSDSEEFAHSSVINAESCGVNPEPRKPVICPAGEYAVPFDHIIPSYETTPRYHPYDEDNDDSSYRRDSSGRNEPIERTLSIQRREYVCFTTRPVPTCEEGSEPEDEYDVTVDYHCLPSSDTTTIRLLAESKHRVLTELANKKVDFSGSVSAATSCSSY